MSKISAVNRPAGRPPSRAPRGSVLLLGWVAVGAALAAPVSTPLEPAVPKSVDREPLLRASAAVGNPLALPFGGEVLTGNSNLDLLLALQRVAPLPIAAASRAAASAGPTRLAAPRGAVLAASWPAGRLPDLLFPGDAKMETQAPGTRREWLGKVRSAESGSLGDGGNADTAVAPSVDERQVDSLAEGMFRLRIKQLIDLLRDNRGWVLAAAALLVSLGAAWKTFGRRL